MLPPFPAKRVPLSLVAGDLVVAGVSRRAGRWIGVRSATASLSRGERAGFWEGVASTNVEDRDSEGGLGWRWRTHSAKKAPVQKARNTGRIFISAAEINRMDALSNQIKPRHPGAARTLDWPEVAAVRHAIVGPGRKNEGQPFESQPWL